MKTTGEDEKKLSALLGLAENFSKIFPSNMLDLWMEMLTPYSAAHVVAAVKVVIDRYEYKTIPPFAVLKRALNDLMGTSESSLELQAIAEWGILLDTIDSIGYYRTPHLHQTTAYVVRLLGGWQTVCCWPEKGMEFRRKDFLEYWKHAHGREDKMQLGADAVKFALIDKRRTGYAVSTRDLVKSLVFEQRQTEEVQ
ncbi:MAG: hypothetical protein LBQ51_10640 [Desulfovibrio sp.]|jgi:hypothetical protein|nr:hypothetical protein [Desulfovibrio sp.]